MHDLIFRSTSSTFKTHQIVHLQAAQHYKLSLKKPTRVQSQNNFVNRCYSLSSTVDNLDAPCRRAVPASEDSHNATHFVNAAAMPIPLFSVELICGGKALTATSRGNLPSRFLSPLACSNKSKLIAMPLNPESTYVTTSKPAERCNPGYNPSATCKWYGM
jgi:hypothetical protein